jgi:DNA ligase-1
MKGAVAPTDLSSLRYPLLASEKIDGWRALVCEINWARDNIPCEPKHRQYFDAARFAIVLSASLKPISNWHVQRQLDLPELIGCDGELRSAEQFNETSSAFASHGGQPPFAFFIFDLFDKPNDPFGSRLLQLKTRHLPSIDDNTLLIKHPHFEILDSDHLTEFMEAILPPSAEGAVTRDPKGLYKYGRATEKQQWMLKIKPFEDAEAVVVGFEELMHNENDPEVSQLGLQKRSSRKDGKVPSGKLGALICKRLRPGDSQPEMEEPVFRIGTGFTDADRHYLWAQQGNLFGKIVVYKSMKRGVLSAPRHPVFKGFRAEDYS